MSSAMQSRRPVLAPWPQSSGRTHGRGSADKILIAFDHACLQNDLEIASLLLVEYERVITRPPIPRDARGRLEMERLIGAHSRLWELRRLSAEAGES